MVKFVSIGRNHIRVDNLKAKSLEELLEEKPNLRPDVLELLAAELKLPKKVKKPKKEVHDE